MEQNLVFDDIQEQEQEPQEQQEQQEKQKQVQSGEDQLRKIKELEQLYNQRLQELAQKEKELEPLLQLQSYLEQSPEKAQKISKILAGEEDIETTEDITISEDKDLKQLKQELQILKSQLQQQTISQQVNKEKEFIQKKIQEYSKMYDYFDPQLFLSAMLSYPEDYLESLTDAEYQKLLDTTAKRTSEHLKSIIENKFQEYLKKKKEIAEKTKSEVQSAPVSMIKEKPEKITMDNAKSIAQKLLEKFLK